MSIKDFKISAIDSSKGLSLGQYKISSSENSKAYGACGFNSNCAGGGGKCGFNSSCAGS